MRETRPFYHAPARRNGAGRRACILTALSIIACTETVVAQAAPAPELGARIRLRISADALAPIRLGPYGWVGGATRTRLIGTWEGRAGDSLVLRDPRSHARVAVPTALVEGVDLSRGHGSSAAAGAGLGSLAGTAIGLVAALRHCTHGTCQTYEGLDTRPVVFVFSGVVGGLLGAGLGAMVGQLIRTERWAEVAETGVALGLDSGGGPVRLSLTIPLGPSRDFVHRPVPDR